MVYNFPKQKLVYGPAQIDALIDQHRGSRETDALEPERLGCHPRSCDGHPDRDSLLYVEPLYLRARNSRMPELKQVIVAYGSHVEMTDTLEESLRRVFRAVPRPASRRPRAHPWECAGSAASGTAGAAGTGRHALTGCLPRDAALNRCRLGAIRARSGGHAQGRLDDLWQRDEAAPAVA